MRMTSGLIAALLLIAGCSDKSSNRHSGIPIVIPLSGRTIPLQFSEIVDSLQYIKLETTNESLIGNIDKLFATRDRLILLDSENAKSIYLFDHQGRFINKISRAGRGSNEYMSIYDIAINQSDEQIIVWDSTADKLLTYKFDGTFVETIPFPFLGDDIEYLGNDLLAFYCDYAPNKNIFESNKSANLIVFNLKSRETKFDLFFDNTKIGQENFMSAINNFSLFRGEVLLWPTMTNSLYNISPNGGSEKYWLDFGFPFETQMEEYIDNILTVSAIDATESEQKAYLPFGWNFLTSDNVIFLLYRRGNTYYYGFYYPETGTFKEGARVFDGTGTRIPVDNNIDQTLPFMPMAADPNDHFYYVIESAWLDHFKETTSDKIRDLIETSTPNDNPIIVKAFMKKL